MDDPPPYRRSPRLIGYDYGQPSLYFVTVCTADRAPLLGQIIDGAPHLSPAGRATQHAWETLPLRFPSIVLDAFIVMPDHVHGILAIGADPNHPATPTLAAVLRIFKSVSGIDGKRTLGRTGQPFWQRSYHDRILRHDRELTLARQYILDNPARWQANRPSPPSPTALPARDIVS